MLCRSGQILHGRPLRILTRDLAHPFRFLEIENPTSFWFCRMKNVVVKFAGCLAIHHLPSVRSDQNADNLLSEMAWIFVQQYRCHSILPHVVKGNGAVPHCDSRWCQRSQPANPIQVSHICGGGFPLPGDFCRYFPNRPSILSLGKFCSKCSCNG